MFASHFFFFFSLSALSFTLFLNLLAARRNLLSPLSLSSYYFYFPLRSQRGPPFSFTIFFIIHFFLFSPLSLSLLSFHSHSLILLSSLSPPSLFLQALYKFLFYSDQVIVKFIYSLVILSFILCVLSKKEETSLLKNYNNVVEILA